MGKDEAVGLAVRSFLGKTRDQIVGGWTAAVRELRSTPNAGRALLAEHAHELLEEIADLADGVLAGASLDQTFELAREKTPTVAEHSVDVSRLVAEFSTLRACVVAAWQRVASAAGDDAELRAIEIAIDALIAASVSSRHEAARAQVERLAAESEDPLGKLESLLSASPVGIAFLDRNLRYLRINEALAAVNGRPVAEHVGRSIIEMLPDAAPLLEPLLREVMASGQPVLNRELTRPSPASGEPQTYLATFFPIRARSGEIMGVGGLVADVTDARRAEQDWRRVQQRMQSILEHAPASIWVKDGSGRIVLANHRLADALGHPYEHVIGRRSEDLLPADVATQHRTHDLLVMRERRAIEAEEVVPGPDGNRTFLSIKFPLPGDPPMVGGIATDISDRKRMEEELRVAVRARERVLAAVSHDLRNPLNTIQLASATLLSQLAGDQRWRRHLEVIHRSSLRMEHLIADLLDMASIGAGRFSIQSKPELADGLVREAIELHQPLADEKKISLIVGGTADHALVDGDRQRVMQVFDNLIGNALKFCRAGDTVTIGCERGDGAVRFWVEDTGPGIAIELLPHLFDPYWSGPDTRTGVGLGLYIARGIVTRHGGDIDVESTFGRGTRFWFTIPLTEHSKPSSGNGP
jgi:PAS domain S-box-containing protein